MGVERRRHGVVLAAVALAVMRRRRDAFARACDARCRAAPGAATLIAGLSVYLIGRLGADLFLTRMSFVLVLTGVTWLLAGATAVRRRRAAVVSRHRRPAAGAGGERHPLPAAGGVAYRRSDASAAGVAVFRDGNLLELPSTTLEVAEACSGLRSIAAGRHRRPACDRASMDAPRAAPGRDVPVAIVMNGLRIAATGLARPGTACASGSWHTFGGWLTFLASVFAVALLQRAWPAGRAPAAWKEAAAA
jgi:exosortase/archaeosortase family protein